MAGEHDGGPAAQVGDQVEDLAAAGRVEGSGGLVEQEQVGLAGAAAWRTCGGGRRNAAAPSH
jgi:hypothetical protein